MPINPYALPRDQWGRFATGVRVPSPELLEKEKRRRAKEWRKFREDYLYSQEHLASMLQCTRRTVSSVEAAATIPSLRIQRAFRALLKQERRAA